MKENETHNPHASEQAWTAMEGGSPPPNFADRSAMHASSLGLRSVTDARAAAVCGTPASTCPLLFYLGQFMSSDLPTKLWPAGFYGYIHVGSTNPSAAGTHVAYSSGG